MIWIVVRYDFSSVLSFCRKDPNPIRYAKRHIDREQLMLLQEGDCGTKFLANLEIIGFLRKHGASTTQIQPNRTFVFNR